MMVARAILATRAAQRGRPAFAGGRAQCADTALAPTQLQVPATLPVAGEAAGACCAAELAALAAEARCATATSINTVPNNAQAPCPSP